MWQIHRYHFNSFDSNHVSLSLAANSNFVNAKFSPTFRRNTIIVFSFEVIMSEVTKKTDYITYSGYNVIDFDLNTFVKSTHTLILQQDYMLASFETSRSVKRPGAKPSRKKHILTHKLPHKLWKQVSLQFNKKRANKKSWFINFLAANILKNYFGGEKKCNNCAVRNEISNRFSKLVLIFHNYLKIV